MTPARDELIGVVEGFLEGLASGRTEDLPLHPEFTAESPLFPEASGAAAWAYVGQLAKVITAIEYVEHIVEGTSVASLFVEKTRGGDVRVFSRFHIEDGLITDARVFYNPLSLAAEPRHD